MADEITITKPQLLELATLVALAQGQMPNRTKFVAFQKKYGIEPHVARTYVKGLFIGIGRARLRFPKRRSLTKTQIGAISEGTVFYGFADFNKYRAPELAEEWGFDVETIRQRANKFRSSAGKSKGKERITTDAEDNLIELELIERGYEIPKSGELSEIGAGLGISGRTVRRRMKEILKKRK